MQAPGNSFPRLVQFLRFAKYRPYLLPGIVISVGGLTDSLGKVSSQALLEFLRGGAAVETVDGASADDDHIWLGSDMLQVLKKCKGTDRVIIPALKVIQSIQVTDKHFCALLYYTFEDCQPNFKSRMDLAFTTLEGKLF